jgi:hypothetical protein
MFRFMRHLLRAAALLATFACQENIAHYASLTQPAPTPAFLGDASGQYFLVVQNGLSVPPDSTTTSVVEVGGQIFFYLPSFGFSLNGVLRTDGNQRKFDFQKDITTEDEPVSLFSHGTVGLDSIQLSFATGADSDACASGVFGENSECLLFRKACDFDESLAGVYSAVITRSAQDSGDCSQAPDLSGNRDWALSVANALSSSQLVSLNGGVPEFSTQLDFDHLAQHLTLAAIPAQVIARPFFDTGSSFDMLLASSDTESTLSGGFAYVNGSCTRQYQVSASRVSGTKPGIICQPPTGECSPDFSLCPQAPNGNGTYSFTTNVAQSGNECPETVCTLSFDAYALCDTPSRQIAVRGCDSGKRPALSEGQDASGNPCTVLGCEDAAICGGEANPGIDPQDECYSGDTVFVTANGSNCTTVTCGSSTTLGGGSCGVSTHAPPCNILNGQPISLHDNYDNCPYLACSFNGALDVLGGASWDLLANGYSVSGWQPSLDDPSNATRTAVISAGSDCPPLDLTALLAVCPLSNDFTGVCKVGGDTDTQGIQNQLVLYRTLSDKLCFAVANAATNEIVDGATDRSPCVGESALCCSQVVSAYNPLALSMSCNQWKTAVSAQLTGSSEPTINLYDNGVLVEGNTLGGPGNYSLGSVVRSHTFSVTSNIGGCTIAPASGTMDLQPVTVNVDCP